MVPQGQTTGLLPDLKGQCQDTITKFAVSHTEIVGDVANTEVWHCSPWQPCYGTEHWKVDQVGQGSEQPDLVSGVPARCGGVGLDDL